MNSAIDVKLGRPSHTTILHRPWFFFWNPSEFFLRYGRFCDVTTCHFWSKIGQTSRVCGRCSFFLWKWKWKTPKDVTWEALQDGYLGFYLQSGAALTMTSSRVKVAHFVENELGHLHVEKRDRWGARWARGTSWKSANLRHRVYMLKSRREIGEKCEKALSTRVVGNLRRPPKTCHSSSESWENGDSEYVIRYAGKIRPFLKFQYLYNIRYYFSGRI